MNGESQAVEWKESWRDDYLRWVCGFANGQGGVLMIGKNDVVNAFFRSGEIELWGRGIEKIFDACRDADSLPLTIQLQGHDLWVEFPFSETYLAKLQGDVSSGNRVVNGLVESQRKILQMVKSNPHVSKKTMAETIGISTTAIDKNIEKLKAQGFLKRAGSPKGGYWEVLK